MKHFLSILTSFAFAFVATTGPALANPLFDSDEILTVEIAAPFDDLVRNAPKSTAPYPATMSVNGVETYDIELSARGNSRRDKKLCSFPPLRVEFIDKPDKGLIFEDQKRLKLVTHCKKSTSYQEYYLLEYTAYKLLNAITDESLKVRLAKIEYIDSDDGDDVASRYGFFIEDTDDAAKRLNLKEVDVADIDVTQLNKNAAARFALFQYMIGNLDWSMHNGPPGDDCCHNTKLVGDEDAMTELLPIPYDFDYSGFVDAPYAQVPDSIRVRRVTSRRFRGFCIHNDELPAHVEAFKTASDELYAVLDATPELREKTRNKAKRFLSGFFKTIGNEDDIQEQLIEYCR